MSQELLRFFEIRPTFWSFGPLEVYNEGPNGYAVYRKHDHSHAVFRTFVKSKAFAFAQQGWV